MPVDLLLYAVIAVAMIFWLKNVLGTKHGSERDRSEILERLREQQELIQKQAKESGKIVDITDFVQSMPPGVKLPIDGIEIEGGAETAQEIVDFIRFDPTFNPPMFINGAKEAFPMIVEAFAKGDLKTLKMLLSEGVYATFEQSIEDRRTRGETLITDVHAVRACRLMSIRKIDKLVFVKLRFIAEEAIAVKDREGNVISGHPDKLITMNDVWTFGRDPTSKDPTWYLYETSDDVVDLHPNPVPDAK